MNRRSFFQTLSGAAAFSAASSLSHAALPKASITRVRYYQTPADAAGRPNTHQPLFNQSSNVVVVETDQGLSGIGEGGAHDTMVQCAGMVIGANPFRIEDLWQTMYRGYFYPAGREKLHALGALDVALWDLKAKALDVPLYQLLGGLTREYVECYSTGYPQKGDLKETARACVEAGFRAYRTEVPGAAVFDRFEQVRKCYESCREIREGVGRDGAWCIDYHTRLDMPDAIALSGMIESLRPYFCEDLVRSENPTVYRTLRTQVKVPIAVGEQFGARWDANDLIEQQLIDYARVTVPNVGGVTEYRKIAEMCETHYVGLCPHFTGPISEAAMVHVCGSFSGPVMMEMLREGTQEYPYLRHGFDFRQGKLWPNSRPGIGVEVDTSKLQLIADIKDRYTALPLQRRPDGSVTNW